MPSSKELAEKFAALVAEEARVRELIKTLSARLVTIAGERHATGNKLENLVRPLADTAIYVSDHRLVLLRPGLTPTIVKVFEG